MEWFIQLHRKLTEWEWYTDWNTFRVFTHLLLNANWKEKQRKWLNIDRWEVLTGRIKLSEQLKLSQQQIRTSLNKLKSTNEITIKSTNKYSLIKIINYDRYQTEQPTKHQTSNQQVTTTNKDNNIIIKQEAEWFIKFWNKLFNKNHISTKDFINIYISKRKTYKKEDIVKWIKEYHIKNKDNLKDKEWMNTYYLTPYKFIKQSNWFISYL